MKRVSSAISPILSLLLWLLAPGSLGARESAPPRVVLPEPGPLPEIRTPLPEEGKVLGSWPLWHLPSERIPIVALSVVVPCGAVNDPPGKAGLAALTAAMLDEGAGERGTVELADELDFLGASLDVSASRESSTLSLRVLRRNLEPALDLLADVLLRPRFEEREWRNVQSLWINSLAQGKRNPSGVARLVASRVFFGDDHPYGRPVNGLQRTVASLTLADVRNMYRRHWRPEGAMLIGAGAISTAELEALLGPRLRAWKGSGDPPRRAPPPSLPEMPRPRLVVVDKPQAAQTIIRVMGPGIARNSPDFVPLSLGNVAFGGSFTSRLTRNLREKNAYTYDVFSAFSRLRGPGAFVTVTAVKSDVTGEALAEIAREYRDIHRDGVTEEEILKARASMKQSIVESLETLSGTVGIFESLAVAGLPARELGRLTEEIRGTGAERVDAAVGRTIRWDAATVVLVGDLKTIEREMAALDLGGLGPLTVVNEEGDPLREP